MVMGEITTTAKVDIPAIVRDVVLDIGYNDSSLCFDGNTCAVLTSIHAQSPDIAMGVDEALESRELIKVKILESCQQDKNEIASELSLKLDAEIVQILGRTIILYRESEKEIYRLP